MLEQAKMAGAATSNLEFQQWRDQFERKQQNDAFFDGLEKDTSYLTSTYDELNPDSPNYNSALHREVTEAYQEVAVSGEVINPNVSLKSVGDRIMRAARNAAATASADAEKSVAQAASSSVKSESGARETVTPGTTEWMQTVYNPSNPEHRKIADDYVANNQYR